GVYPLRGLAGGLEKREAAGDAAGFDRLRAEREVVEIDTDRALAAIERARAQATVASFFAEVPDSSQIVAVAQPRQSANVPALEALVAQAEAGRGELLALRREGEAAGFAQRAADRRRIPEPEIVAGTKSSTVGGGDVGSVFTVHAAIPLFERGRPKRAAALSR